jgi:hypothetical protein
MRGLLASALMTTALAGAASADAKTYVGKGSDGTRVTLETNAAGEPTRVRFGRYEAACSGGYDPVKDPFTGLKPPFTEVSSQALLDRGRERLRRGAVDVKVSWRFEASYQNNDSWRGRYRTKGVFIAGGEPYTRCRARFSFELSPA